jgi:hypothetical protein
VWSDVKPFMNFTTQTGRTMLRKRYTPPDLVSTKWNLQLPSNFQLDWGDTWDAERARKEAGLIWRLWHKAIVVNKWRGRISANIDTSCTMCTDAIAGLSLWTSFGKIAFERRSSAFQPSVGAGDQRSNGRPPCPPPKPTAGWSGGWYAVRRTSVGGLGRPDA